MQGELTAVVPPRARPQKDESFRCAGMNKPNRAHVETLEPRMLFSAELSVASLYADGALKVDYDVAVEAQLSPAGIELVAVEAKHLAATVRVTRRVAGVGRIGQPTACPSD